MHRQPTTGDSIISTAVIPWLDPAVFLPALGGLALVVVCLIVFAETGLLVGFILPGDTLLIITGLLAFSATDAPATIDMPIWLVCLCISVCAFLGGEVGYLIGRKAGPRVFERKESGFFSVENVQRTNKFFERFGGIAVIVARFVPVVRTFAPVAAGVGHMDPRRYSLYNAIGAVVWGSGLTFAGYLLGYIPPVADFVTTYIEYILLGAICLGVFPTLYHYLQARRKAKRSRAAGVAAATAESLVLDPNYFDQDKSNDPAK